MGFFSRSSGRKPYGKHGHRHYQRKGMLGKLFRALESGSHPRHYPQHHEYHPKQEGSSRVKAVVCGKCHAEIPAGSKFCLQCGEKVETVLFCVNCGEKLPPSAKFCSACGTKTNS